MSDGMPKFGEGVNPPKNLGSNTPPPEEPKKKDRLDTVATIFWFIIIAAVVTPLVVALWRWAFGL